METIILVTLVGILNLLAFLIGARTAQKISKNEEITLPRVNPMEAYREYKEKQEQQEQNRLNNLIMENINNYSGDATGQKPVK